ncbi:MAG: hypothetical protein WCS97_00110 [Candidatus Paceibacterota bacterium]|jgi:hypothetical protein
MKTIFEHIEYAKGKPHHIRKRIVFGVAGIGTSLIALVWFVGTLSSGKFAIQGSTFAESTSQEPAITTDTGSNSHPAVGGIAGAAAALQDGDVPAHIEIVDTSPSKLPVKQAEQTILPF